MSEETKVQKSITPITVALTELRLRDAALRKPDEKTPKFTALLASIKTHGILSPLLVRKVVAQNEKFYEVLEGSHRYAAALRAGLEEVPCMLIEATDVDALNYQIICNYHRKDTMDREYAVALRRIYVTNNLSLPDLSKMTSIPLEHLTKLLQLGKIESKVVWTMIEEGQIPVSLGTSIANMPEDEQVVLARRYVSGETIQDLMPEIKEKNTIFSKQRSEERKAREAEAVFTPKPALRKISELETILSEPQHVNALASKVESLPADQAVAFLIKWLMHLDAESLAEQEAAFERRRAEQVLRSNQRAKESEEKKAARDAAKAAKLQAELEALKGSLQTN